MAAAPAAAFFIALTNGKAAIYNRKAIFMHLYIAVLCAAAALAGVQANK